MTISLRSNDAAKKTHSENLFQLRVDFSNQTVVFIFLLLVFLKMVIVKIRLI